MSVAIQANERLNALLQSSIRIEGLLKADDKKDKAAIKGGEKSTAKPTIVDAALLTGLSSSMTKLLKQADNINPKTSTKLKTFLVDFSAGVKEANENLKDVKPESLMKDLSSVASGIFKLTLATSFAGIAAPLTKIGSKSFTSNIKNISTGLTELGKEKPTEGVKNLMVLSGGIAKFALTMALIAAATPLIALGTLVVALSIKGLVKTIAILGNKKGAEIAKNLSDLSKGIALFAVDMVLIAIAAPLIAAGTLVIALSILAVVKVIDFAFKTKSGQKNVVDSLAKLDRGLAMYALTLALVAITAPLIALGTIVLALSIGAFSIALGVLGSNKAIEKGSKVLKSMTSSIVIFGIALGLIGIFASYVAIGALTMTLSIIAVGGSVYLLGLLNKSGFVTSGTKALSKLALPMLGFAISAAIIGSLIKDDPGVFALKMAVVGAAIVVLGYAAVELGQPEIAVFAEIGAGVLISLGASLLVFSAALFILSKANFSKEQADNLGYAMWAIGKSVAKIGILSIPIALGAVVLIPMSIALLPFSSALKRFKSVGWVKEDGIALQDALKSVVQGFVHSLDGVGIKGLLKAMAAIPLINDMGNALVSLAAGVKAMATLTFTETEYDSKTGKLIPKREVKLTDAEIQGVGPNVAKIITALAEPLTMFGMWASAGTTAVGPWRIGSSYMDAGISAAAKVGNVISSIAEGVAKMANLEIVEYEVINGGTENAKLVPKGSRKLIDTDFTAAGTNVASILNALVTPLTDFGVKFKDGSDWFNYSGLEAGIKGATMVGGIISGLADGVAKMANGEVIENVIINPGTKDAKIVPKGMWKLGKPDFDAAAANVNDILNALITPLTDFGMKLKDGSSWFTDSGLEAGIKGIGTIGDPIAKLADTVIKMASGQITISEIIDGKIVPKSMLSFREALPDAKIAMEELLNMFPDVLIKFGESVKDKKDTIQAGMDLIPEFEKSAKNVATISEKYKAIIENLQAGKKAGIDPAPILTSFANSMALMGNSFDKMLPNKLEMYKGFAATTEGLTKIIDPFEKFTKLFGQFTKDMGGFVTIWQKFGKDETLNFKTYAESLKTISTVDVGKLTAVTSAIKEQTLNQSANKNQNQNQGNGGNPQQNTPGFLNTGIGGAGTNTATPTTPPPANNTPIRDQKQPESPFKIGTTIAELRVTNLYLNGKLQQ